MIQMLSKCMRLHRAQGPLKAEVRELAPPQQGQVLLKVRACGVCRTDLHIVDGELPGARPDDRDAQRFAEQMRARWTGDSNAIPPARLDAAIIFAPVGALVPAALRVLSKGGTLVCGGIHMTDIPSMPYSLLWGERVVRSVANLTRRDSREFFELIARSPVNTHVETFDLSEANEALDRLRSGRLSGAAVLIP